MDFWNIKKKIFLLFLVSNLLSWGRCGSTFELPAVAASAVFRTSIFDVGRQLSQWFHGSCNLHEVASEAAPVSAAAAEAGASARVASRAAHGFSTAACFAAFCWFVLETLLASNLGGSLSEND